MTDDPQDPVGQALRAAEAAIDQLVVLANRSDTRDQLCEEKRLLGQLLTRCEMLCSYALTVKPAPSHIRRVS